MCSGYDSIEKIALGDSEKMHIDIVSINKVKHIYKGNIGDSDAQFLIDDAKIYLKYNGIIK